MARRGKAFSSFSDLVDAIKKDNNIQTDISEELKKKGAEISDEALKNMAKELEEMILNNLDSYYASYNPLRYNRTRTLLNMFGGIEFDKKSRTIYIPFNSNAVHKNAVKSDQHYSFVPILLDFGWSVKGSTTPRSRFAYYEGSGFISDAISSFNAKYRDKGVRAQLEYNGSANMGSWPYLM